MSRVLVILALSCSLGACASTGAGAGGQALTAGIGGAVAAPFRDLNLVRRKTPPALLEAAKGPYRAPDPLDCAVLEAEIRRLDLALGPDVDSPAAVVQSLSARGSQLVSNAAVDAVEDLTTGWIPYRGLVRQVTGASRHEKRIEEATHAGAIRRAFLKGLRHRERCGEEVQPAVEANETPAEAPEAPVLVEAAATVAPPAPAPADPGPPADPAEAVPADPAEAAVAPPPVPPVALQDAE